MPRILEKTGDSGVRDVNSVIAAVIPWVFTNPITSEEDVSPGTLKENAAAIPYNIYSGEMPSFIQNWAAPVSLSFDWSFLFGSRPTRTTVSLRYLFEYL